MVGDNGDSGFLSANFPTYHATIAYRDIFLMYYNVSAIIFLFLRYNKNNDRFFIFAGINAGFATFTKLEAVGYLFLQALALLGLLSCTKRRGLRKKANQFLKFIVPGLGIYLIYAFYKQMHHIRLGQNRFSLEITARNFQRVGPITQRFFEELFLSGNWNILWFILIISLVVHRARVMRSILAIYVGGVLFLYLGFYFIVALATPNFVSIAGSHSYTVLSRIILHFFPLCVLGIIFANYLSEKEPL